MKTITTLLLVLFPLMALSEESETPSRSGAHFAVTEFKKEEGFKLSEEALKTLGVDFQTLKGTSNWSLPSDAIVHLKHTSGVYRRLDGWITYVIVKIQKKSRDIVSITSEDLQPGDEVATKGTQFLRMTEVDLNTDTIDGCAH